MTTYTSEPGTRLGGRYRLEDRIAAGAGWAAWKAIDEILARAVTVFTFAPGFPRVAEVATAARAASRLTDPRLAQVFDVEDTWDRAYIVMEWAAGETLGDMLSHGPIEPDRAGRMIAEAAGALSSAHAAGVAHMCLSPGSVRWSPTGEVKIVGLGIDAALSGTSADDPVATDTIGLGRLLYAALTATWPGQDYPALPAAPATDGRPYSPRQVVAGIPAALSDLTCRAMRLHADSAGAPVTTPEEFARALAATVPPARPSWQSLTPGDTATPRGPGWARQDDGPVHGGRGPWGGGPADRDEIAGERADAGRTTGWTGGAAGATSGWSSLDGLGWPDRTGAGQGEPSARDLGARAGYGYADAGPGAAAAAAAAAGVGAGPGRRHASAGSRAGRRRAPRSLPGNVPVGVIVAAAALVVAAIGAFTLWPGGGGTPAGHASAPPTTPASSVTALRPRSAAGFDPLTPSDTHQENSQKARYAIDGSARTAWTSQYYYTASFGGLKSGSGLIIDMGRKVTLTSVTVTFGGRPGADVKLLAGNSGAHTAANLAAMRTIGSAVSPTGAHTFTISGHVTGRFLVIWFTRLPPMPGSHHRFMAEIFNVAVRGTDA